MKKVLLGIFCFCFIVVLSGCSKIQTGDRITCKNCNKVIQDTVHEVTVPFWEGKDYRINYQTTYCNSCGNEQVPYTIHYICKNCSTEYKTETQYAPRREERTDQIIKNTYCNVCAVQEVPYQIIHICTECGKTIGAENRTAQRIEEKKDQEVDDICDSCRLKVKAQAAAKKFGEFLGGVGASFGRGIGKGVEESR